MHLAFHVYDLLTFQVYDLQYASPATISRCGMVYVDPKNLGYLPYWQKWLKCRGGKEERDDLKRMFDKYVPALIDMVVEGIQDGRQGERLRTIVPLSSLNMVRREFVSRDIVAYSAIFCIFVFVKLVVWFKRNQLD